jgi:hypothetical protein
VVFLPTPGIPSASRTLVGCAASRAAEASRDSPGRPRRSSERMRRTRPRPCVSHCREYLERIPVGTTEMKAKKKGKRRRTESARAAILQIKTTLVFGEEGVPLERLGEIAKALKDRHMSTEAADLLGIAPLCPKPDTDSCRFRWTDIWISRCRATPRPSARNSLSIAAGC